jgi:hypothetical protein
MRPDGDLTDFLSQVDGWTILSVRQDEDGTQVRMAGPVSDEATWPRADGMLWITGRPERGSALLGAQVSVDEAVRAGDWVVDRSLIAGCVLLDLAIVCTVDSLEDPIGQPGAAVNALASATPLWQAPGVSAGNVGGAMLHLLGRAALLQPVFAATVECSTELESADRVDLLLSPWCGVEVQRAPSPEAGAAFVFFHPLDLPGRLWERSGLSRLLSDPEADGARRNVSVRTTFVAEQGLVHGALTWQEDAGGVVGTECGPRSALVMASEVLAMLPGGQLDGTVGAGQEAVSGS